MGEGRVGWAGLMPIAACRTGDRAVAATSAVVSGSGAFAFGSFPSIEERRRLAEEEGEGNEQRCERDRHEEVACSRRRAHGLRTHLRDSPEFSTGAARAEVAGPSTGPG